MWKKCAGRCITIMAEHKRSEPGARFTLAEHTRFHGSVLAMDTMICCWTYVPGANTRTPNPHWSRKTHVIVDRTHLLRVRNGAPLRIWNGTLPLPRNPRFGCCWLRPPRCTLSTPTIARQHGGTRTSYCGQYGEDIHNAAATSERRILQQQRAGAADSTPRRRPHTKTCGRPRAADAYHNLLSANCAIIRLTGRKSIPGWRPNMPGGQPPRVPQTTAPRETYAEGNSTFTH